MKALNLFLVFFIAFSLSLAQSKVYLNLINQADLPSNPIDIALRSGYAYVVCESIGIYRIDVSNPYGLMKPEFLNITISNAKLITFNGAYAYIAQDNGRIRIISLKNDLFPVNAGYFDTFSKIEKMVVDGGYLYYIRKDFGMHVVDVTNPEIFIPRGNQLVPGDANGLFIKNNYAYVTTQSAYLSIIDIKSAEGGLMKLPIVGTYNFGLYFYDVFVSDNYAYVSQGTTGVQVLNVKDPAKPKWETNIFARRNVKNVIVSGFHTWVNDDVTIQAFYNRDPKTQLWAGSYDNNNWSINKFLIDDGKYIYLLSSDRKMKIVSIDYSY